MSKLRNKIAGSCYRCGGRCEIGEGHVELVTELHYEKWPGAHLKKWLVQHVDCAILYRGTNVHCLYAPADVAPTGAALEEARARSREFRNRVNSEKEENYEEVLSGSELSHILNNFPL